LCHDLFIHREQIENKRFLQFPHTIPSCNSYEQAVF
jgi:hypothetical protein